MSDDSKLRFIQIMFQGIYTVRDRAGGVENRYETS